MPATQYCELEQVLYRQPFYTSTVIRKGSWFKEQIVLAYCWIREVGILKYQHNFWSEEKPLCNLDEIDYTSVSMDEVVSAYKMLLCGMALSIMTLGLEILIHFIIIKKNSLFYNA